MCLAAVHAGIIDGRVGGGLFVSRFFRHDWSNTSTQSVFPFTSSRGSFSNGVQSVAVPSDWYSLPSSATECSYTVRGRGDHVMQRRQAPFSPRVGHAALSTYLSVSDEYLDVVTVHWVIGGVNASGHYLNDVWVAVAELRSAVTTHVDVVWLRLADAPFSPRSDMHALVINGVDPSFGLTRLFVLGGQLSHACGLRELGVCSSEAWVATVQASLLDNGTIDVNVTWAPGSEQHEALFSLPKPSRCGAALISRDSRENYMTFTLVGGQLSYDDSSCSSAPVTVNEQWWMRMELSLTERWPPFVNASWEALPPAPFSPRRWEVLTCLLLYSTICWLPGASQHLAVRPVGDGAACLRQAGCGPTSGAAAQGTRMSDRYVTGSDRASQWPPCPSRCPRPAPSSLMRVIKQPLCG
jgi:hypothetical protein